MAWSSENEGTCQVYVGKFCCQLPMSPPVAAVALSLLALLLVIGLTRMVAGFKESGDLNA